MPSAFKKVNLDPIVRRYQMKSTWHTLDILFNASIALLSPFNVSSRIEQYSEET